MLGVREGASENAEVTSALLEDLVERGLDPGRRRLFVIDGSKALRKAREGDPDRGAGLPKGVRNWKSSPGVSSASELGSTAWRDR